MYLYTRVRDKGKKKMNCFCKFSILCTLLFSGLSGSAQYNFNWTFGDSILLTFPGGSTPITDSAFASSQFEENSSSLSDSSGKLLLFSDGYFIFDSNGNQIPDGDLLDCSNTIIQGTMILPKPCHPLEYYVLFLSHYMGTFSGKYHLYYSLVQFDNGLTNPMVIQKNIPVYIDTVFSLSEKLTAVKHANGKDFWILSHTTPNPDSANQFIKFILSEGGIDGPFIQAIGSDQNIGFVPNGFGGQLAANQQGDKLCSVTPSGIIDVFDFDRCYGTLSNFISLGVLSSSTGTGDDTYYGCSFSPNSSKLYVSEGYGHSFYQFDLNAPDIFASKTVIFQYPGNKWFGLHLLGPDNKIYASQVSTVTSDTINYYLCKIDSPDSAGLACGFIPRGHFLGSKKCNQSLPNIPNIALGSMAVITACLPDSISICENDTLLLGTSSPIPNSVSSIWSHSGMIWIQDSLSGQTKITANSNGWIYWTVFDSIIGLPCGLSTDSSYVTLIPASEFPFAYAGEDTVLCLPDSLILGMLDTSGGLWTYSWESILGQGYGNTSVLTLYADTNITLVLTVSHQNANGSQCAIAHDTVKIEIIPLNEWPQANAGSDTAICGANTLTIGNPDPSGGLWGYNWSNSSDTLTGNMAQLSIMPSVTTQYFLSVTHPTAPAGCREDRDTVTVTVEASVTAPSLQGVTACIGETVQIGTNGIPGYVYLWNPGTGLSDSLIPDPLATIQGTTIYSLTIINPVLQSACKSATTSQTVTVKACDLPTIITGTQSLTFTGYSGTLALTVYDMRGRLIYKSADYHGEISADKMAMGMYWYALQSSDPKELAGERKLVVLH